MMESKAMTTRLLPIAAMVSMVFSASASAETVATTSPEATANTELQRVVVKGKRQRLASTEQKNRALIEQEMIHDSRDLVRYSTDVGLADDGRRLKGFAMRGVEGNRVGISIDGVALPDSEENSLFARYGNFNNSRLSIDPELVRGIDIVKGSDSFTSGSGALGGNVNYRTLDAQDIVQGDQRFGAMLKHGYASKNSEWVHTLGLGFVGEQVDAALLYSQRRGHETKSTGGEIEPFVGRTEKDRQKNAKIGAARITPDLSHHKNHSYLAKIGWQISPEHRVGASVNGQKGSNYTYEDSYALTTYWREADDTQKRLNTNLYYQWTPKSSWLSLLQTDFDYQKTENGAINYKGNRDVIIGGNWRTGYIYQDKSPVVNLDNRNNQTKYKRFTLRLDSQPFQFLGNHQLSFKAFTARRDFENINRDEIWDKGTLNHVDNYTIQVPVKTTQYGFSLLDNITWNSVFSGRLGVRYDHEKLEPQALKVGVPCGKQSSFGRVCADSNPASKTFAHWNGVLGLDAKLNDVWKVGYEVGTGYRVPTASEMYFTFESPYGNWKSNPNLKAERSVNQTLSLQGRGAKGELDVNLYYTRYRHFLFEKETVYDAPNPYYGDWYACYQNKKYCDPTIPELYQQMVNVDKARISGLEVKGHLNLNTLLPVGEGWKLSGALGYSKGKLSGENTGSLLSIQPLKVVMGLDYEAPSNKWGIYSRLTYLGSKKPKDAQIAEQETRVKAGSCRFDWWTYTEVCDTEYYTDVHAYKWLNKKDFVFDLFGFYKPVKNLTLRAGVYNLFNRKYHTWDSLRGMNRRSTINTVDWSTGQGLERYYAPGRNYAVSLEYKF